MAAPILQTQGTVAAVTSGNLAVTLPAYVANDIVVLTTVGYIPNTTVGANTQSLSSPWTKYSPNVTTITGGLIDTEHAFWWARATSSSSLGTTVTITRPANWDTGTDTVWAGRAYVVRGCETVGNPYDQLVASAISTAANPQIPAITVSGNERNVLAFYVTSDNLAAPTAATGYTVKTAATTNTGTDAGFQTYEDITNASVSAVTPTGGSTSAQNFQVYFVASFKSAPVTVSRTATNSGVGSSISTFALLLNRSASGSGSGSAVVVHVVTRLRTADGSGLGTETVTGVAVRLSTATGSGTGTETATGTFFTPVVFSRTATGSGAGTQTATGVKVKRKRAENTGISDSVDFFSLDFGNSNQSEVLPVSLPSFVPGLLIGQSFTGNGKTLSQVSFYTRLTPTANNIRVAIYAHTGTYGTNGTGTGSPLATSELGSMTSTFGWNYFSFQNANRITLVNGTKYVAVFYIETGSGFLEFQWQGTNSIQSHSGNYTTYNSTFGWRANASPSSNDISFKVFYANATSLVIKSRTATGSGTGTESATGQIVVAIQRTATGLGTGTEAATGLITTAIRRTATGSGIGTESTTNLVTRFRTATGAGIGTDSATGVRTVSRTATGSGTGTGIGDDQLIHIETASGSGSSTQNATELVTSIRTASGSGSSGFDSTGLVTRFRDANGSGLGSSLTVHAVTKLRTADGSGIGSGLVFATVTTVRTANGSGLGTSTAFKRIILTGIKWSYWGSNMMIP